MHAFTDGRDTLPHAGAGYLAELDGTAGVRVGSVIGRYWAMDRDRRWDRTQRAYDMLVHGRAPHHADSGEQAVSEAYARGETDEFIEPTLVGDEATIRPGDSVIAFNFRPDRMRQLTRALAEPGFGQGERWERRGRSGAARLDRAGGCSADRALHDADRVRGGLALPGRVRTGAPADDALGSCSRAPAPPQLHVAETEKYPHVTYFFNGGEEAPLPGERRELVDSPRDVPTYDHKPQMSARAGGERVRGAPGARIEPRFAIINFANADMVGHTGVIEAAVEAIETVDECLGEVVAAVHERRRRVRRDRRPRQRRSHARARRQSQHRSTR